MWTTSALLGQQPLDAQQAGTIGTLLDLDEETVEALLLPPVRGDAAMDPTEPVTYRLQEALQVYGTSLHELIREEFGDGIMSAIDFTLDLERVEDPKGRPGEADVQWQVPPLQGLVTARAGAPRPTGPTRAPRPRRGPRSGSH